jgi:hypothetical protein
MKSGALARPLGIDSEKCATINIKDQKKEQKANVHEKEKTEMPCPLARSLCRTSSSRRRRIYADEKEGESDASLGKMLLRGRREHDERADEIKKGAITIL